MHYPGKAPPSFVETHRLQPDEGRGRGLHPLDADTVLALRDIRLRPEPRQRARFITGVVAVLVLHLLLAWLVAYEMQPRIQVPFAHVDDREDVLEVRFVEPVRAPPAPEVAALPPRAGSPEASRAEPTRVAPREHAKHSPDTAKADAPSAASPSPAAAAPADSPRAPIFGRDGSIQVATPPAGAAPATQADFVQRRPTDESGIMSHKSTVTYTETRFEKDWAPRDENALNGGMRKVLESTTLKKTVNVGGTRINCSTVLFVLPAGCRGSDPPKPPPKSADGRLNMAPARSLVDDAPGETPRPPEAECIAAFRADKPLPQGCPSDTPQKAMDLDEAERRRKGI